MQDDEDACENLVSSQEMDPPLLMMILDLVAIITPLLSGCGEEMLLNRYSSVRMRACFYYEKDLFVLFLALMELLYESKHVVVGCGGVKQTFSPACCAVSGCARAVKKGKTY